MNVTARTPVQSTGLPNSINAWRCVRPSTSACVDISSVVLHRAKNSRVCSHAMKGSHHSSSSAGEFHVKRQELARRRKPPAAGPYEREIENLAKNIDPKPKKNPCCRNATITCTRLCRCGRRCRSIHTCVSCPRRGNAGTCRQQSEKPLSKSCIPTKPTSGKFPSYSATMESSCCRCSSEQSPRTFRGFRGNLLNTLQLCFHPWELAWPGSRDRKKSPASFLNRVDLASPERSLQP